jgi:hypothetical protein
MKQHEMLDAANLLCCIGHALQVHAAAMLALAMHWKHILSVSDTRSAVTDRIHTDAGNIGDT